MNIFDIYIIGVPIVLGQLGCTVTLQMTEGQHV